MIPPKKAWLPLPSKKWDRQKAIHLASRLGYSMYPEIVDEIEKLGPTESVTRLLERGNGMPPPSAFVSMDEYDPASMRELPPEERRDARKKMQRQNRQSHTSYATDWYAFARDPRNAPQEKLVSFFQNVWVVAFQGAKEVQALFDYQTSIRDTLHKTYPEMCQNLAVSPAMIRYLSLNQNKAGSPNENFARELFELFTLGEGNYTEKDIKEAARACTGYRVNRNGEAVFIRKRHDSGKKTIFGESGRFRLKDVITIVFEQNAATRFLPSEFCKFYLSENPLPEAHLDSLASIWAHSGFDLPTLYKTVFSSRLFYEPEFRANLIKSPEQFYLGMLQDFDLDVSPLPRYGPRLLRLMGQAFFNPPNVRGWVGGKHWINSATLAARRQAINSVLTEINVRRLNADEQRALEHAAEENRNRFTIDTKNLQKTFSKDPSAALSALSKRIYASGNSAFLNTYAERVISDSKEISRNTIIELLQAALSAPEYHLC